MIDHWRFCEVRSFHIVRSGVQIAVVAIVRRMQRMGGNFLNPGVADVPVAAADLATLGNQFFQVAPLV